MIENNNVLVSRQPTIKNTKDTFTVKKIKSKMFGQLSNWNNTWYLVVIIVANLMDFQFIP